MAPGIEPGGVVVPTKGIDGIGNSQAAISDGFFSLSQGLGELATLAQKVQTTGELSEFQDILRQTDEQARVELGKRNDVTDYPSAWVTTCEPRIAEAMKGLSAPARVEAEKLADDFRRRGVIEALRIGGLGKLDKARNQWHSSVQLAAERGDAEAVERQIEAGKDVFVPESKLEETRAEALDSACVARWNRRWKENPAEAMVAMRAGEDQPSTPEKRQALQRMNRNCSRAFKSDFAAMWVEMDARNAVLEPKSLQLARQAGLINDEQVRRYEAGHGSDARTELDVAAVSRWKRRVDTMGNDAEELADARIGLVTSGMPQHVRRELVKRIDTARELPVEDRRRINDCLDRCFREGYLGAPGDVDTWRRKSLAQDQLLAKCAAQGVGEAMAYLADLTSSNNGWVCFDIQGTK